MTAYRGLYINLDRSTDRRGEMERQFAALGLADRYRRFAALEGGAPGAASGAALAPGEVGCFRSHVAALESARDERRFVHVVEDDILVSRDLAPYLDEAIGAGRLDGFDVLLTDMYVSCDLRLIKMLASKYAEAMETGRPRFSIMNLGKLRSFASMTSYLVNPAAIARLLDLYRREMAAGPRQPVDLFLRDQVAAGALRAGCVFPFLTSVKLERIAGNVITGRQADPRSALVMACIRYSFYVERDLDSYAGPILRDAVGPEAADAVVGNTHRDFLLRAFGHVLTKDFALF